MADPHVEQLMRTVARLQQDLEEAVAASRQAIELAQAERYPSRRGGGDEAAAVDDYAFRITVTGRVQIRVRAGSAYMVNETPVTYTDTLLDLPEVAGDYIVLLRHEYGLGGAEGEWAEAPVVVAVADLPSELDGGRIVARNFKLGYVTVAGDGDDAAIAGRPLQGWRSGDVYGYAPYLAPLEGPLVAP